MNIFKNILAVIIGWLIGSSINMGLIKTGEIIFPINGIDQNDMEAYAAAMPDLEPRFFIFPFIAHALGTLIGAFITYLIARTYKTKLGLLIGLLFFLGGVMINYMLTGPIWFTMLDLVVAYFPMAYIGTKLAGNFSSRSRG